MPNFRDGSLQQGQAFAALSTVVKLIADNQAVDVGNSQLLYLSSDNTTASNRTFTLNRSNIGGGHALVIVFTSGSSTTAELADSGNCNLQAAWNPVQGDILALMYDSVNSVWVEVSRSTGTGSVSSTLVSGHIYVGNGSNVATDVALSGDATMANTGAMTIANLAVTNAKVSASAAIDYSKLAALTSGNVLVGSAGNVATSVVMSGDATIIASGALTIAALAVTEAKMAAQAVGLNAERVAIGLFDPSANAGERTVAAHTISVALPAKAIVKRVYYDVLTTFTSPTTDDATIAISIEGANDIVSAVAIDDGGNPWDAGRHATIPVDTPATFVKTTTSKSLVATVAVEALTAGKAYFYVEYDLGF